MAEVISTIKKVRLPQRTLAYAENTGPYAGNTELFERLFNKVLDWANPRGLLTENSESISIYHDDPELVPQEKQRISVGFTIPYVVETSGDIKLMLLPEGTYVVGSFEIDPVEYGDAWNQVMAFLGEEKLNPTGLMYESYKNDPTTHPERKHIVDICVAI